MKCFTAAEMREADRKTISNGTPGSVLMGRAAKALAGELNFFADRLPRPVVVLAGPGNNGGDGFGLAVHLKNLGWPVWVWGAVPRERVRGDALGFLEAAESLGIPFSWKTEPAHWEEAGNGIPPEAWIVDALLGTGVEEAPRGAVAAAVKLLRRVRPFHRIWSVDLPTGLNADTGAPFDPDLCVRADATLTLAGPKPGLTEGDAAEWTGSVSVLDIGVTPGEAATNEDWQVMSDREIRENLPALSVYDHKGSRGHALFVGGSPGMSGSISMAACASLKSGCGLATVLAPFTTAPGIDAAYKEIMVLPGKQSNFMTLSPQNIQFDPYRVVCVGPGLRVNPETIEVVRRVLNECPHPLILDADGLGCLSDIGIRIGDSRRPVFLTPHPGEMARLLEKKTTEIQSDRSAAVCEAVAHSHAHVVLKGTHSRIVNPKGSRWVNLSGNAALATAGTGDVLAGILAGLIARGIRLDMALPVAVVLHGRAGELASIRNGVSSVLAGDVLEALPAVFRHAEGR